MYRIWKHFTFAASHILEGLPEGHQCGRLHGHNYKVEVELSSPTLNDVGFVRDFGELREFKTYLDATFDHRHINDFFPGNPTAERMAAFFFTMCHNHWPEVSAIRVQETETSWAEYRP